MVADFFRLQPFARHNSDLTTDPTMLATVSLIPHPTTPCGVLSALTVVMTQTADTFRVRYDLVRQSSGKDLRVPPAAATTIQRRDGLWKHTCLEVFVRQAGAAAYREFNLAPSGDWAAYAFAAERQRASAGDDGLPAPRIEWEEAAAGWTLSADFAADVFCPPGPLEFNLSAVIEAADGQKSYWALRHPAAQPDFHHPQAFALALDRAP